jgi:hypothetical protein
MVVIGIAALFIVVSGQVASPSPRDTGLVDPPSATCVCLTTDSIAAAFRIAIPVDTPRRRPHAVEVSEWYERRLRIHRYLSYSIIPLFGAQYVAGQRLFNEGSSAPAWAKTTHRAVATTLVGVFGVNTVTGVWNLWDSRHQPTGRALRTTHAIMMLAAEGGFTYAGAKLSQEAETSLTKRREHRTVALASMGVTLAGGLMMRLFNH